MGIHCEINLSKPPNGAYLGTTGTVVSGVIKYAVDEETVFNKITVSLKGSGKVHLVTNKGTSKQVHFREKEVYMDIDNIISEDKDNNMKVAIGTYEIPFKFEIPRNVPPTLAYKRSELVYDAKCTITYYVRIKFEKSGFMNFAKRFKKDINVIPCIIPRLSTTPIIHGGHKKLSQIYTSKSRIIKVKANILNSVLRAGDKITLIYEIINDTNLDITGVETKLVEIYEFYTQNTKIMKNKSDIPETDSKIGMIQSGQTREILVEINVPSDRETAEFSKIFSRNYYVAVTVYLPFPHKKYVLKVPVQIGNNFIDNAVEAASDNVEVTCENLENDVNPPSYWEAMNEYTSDKV